MFIANCVWNLYMHVTCSLFRFSFFLNNSVRYTTLLHVRYTVHTLYCILCVIESVQFIVIHAPHFVGKTLPTNPI